MAGGEPGEVGVPVAVGALGEVEEGLNVLDGRDDAEGDPDRAAGRHAREDEVVIDRRVFRPGPQEEPPRPGEVAAAQPERGLASSRVAEAPGAQRDSRRARVPRHRALVDDRAFRVEEVQGHGAAAGLSVARPVDPHHRRARAVPQPAQALKQPCGEHGDPLADQVDAYLGYPVKPDGHIGDRQEVHRAVLERCLVAEQLVPALTDADRADGPAGEPGSPQPAECVPPGEQAAHPGREAEHLVPAQRHELRPYHRQVELARRYEGGRVEQHVVSGGLRAGHPGQGMTDPAEVGLGRVGE